MTFSIIIPTKNRAAYLARTLQSVTDVVSGADGVEVVVVDNGSSDSTADVFQRFTKLSPAVRSRYVFEATPGLLAGRHRGADEAMGLILSFLDDDVLLAPTWFRALRDVFADPAVALAGGPSKALFEADPPAWLDELWWEFESGRSLGALSLVDQGPSKRASDPCLIWGLNFSIRCDVLSDCGGFHPDIVPAALQRYQGDGETGLALKVKARGLETVYHPELAVSHIIPRSRVTPASLEARAFYQGVCDSYTQVRRDGRVSAAAAAKSWRDPFRPLKRQLHRYALLRRPNASNVRQLMARAHTAGFAFHQGEVREDPQLLAWVLRSDYFDYRLPEGWRDYQ